MAGTGNDIPPEAEIQRPGAKSSYWTDPDIYVPYIEPDFFYHDYDHIYGGAEIRAWREEALAAFDKELRQLLERGKTG